MNDLNNKANTDNEEDDNSKSSCLVPVLMFFAIIIFIIVIFAYISYKSESQSSESSSSKLFKRSAKNSDITIDYDIDISSLGVKFNVIPQVDIDGLEITYKFLDENKKNLYTLTKTLGNVKEGVQVNFTISIVDLSFSIIWNTETISWTVSDGTVSYFA